MVPPGVAGGCHFTVTFSEPVASADADAVGNYLNGNVPFDVSAASADAGGASSATEAVVTLAGAKQEAGASVPTGCPAPFAARDRIGVVGGEIAAASGRRTVGRVEYFISADAVLPSLTISAPEGAGTIWVHSDEPLKAATVLLTLRRSGSAETSIFVSAPDGASSFSAEVPASLGGVVTAGDQLSIASREVTDFAGNQNASVSYTVARDTTAPRAARVTVSPRVAGTPASVTLNGTALGDAARPSLTVTAKAGTSADGAAGNQWQIDIDVVASRPPGWSASQESSVRMSRHTNRIWVQVLSGVRGDARISVSELVTDLNLDSSFSALFSARTLDKQGNNKPIDTGGRVALTGGSSTVDLRVNWSEPVRGCNAASGAVQPRLVEIDTDADGAVDFSLDGYTGFGDSALTFTSGGPRNPSVTAGAANCDTTTPGGFSGGTLGVGTRGRPADDPIAGSGATGRSHRPSRQCQHLSDRREGHICFVSRPRLGGWLGGLTPTSEASEM